MAYANLVAQNCNNQQEAFQRFRDFMCKRAGTYDYSTLGVGWTLFDSSYATSEDVLTTGDWFVMYSAGEDGLRDLYFKFVYNTSTNYIGVWCYLSWDAGTSTGTQVIGSSTHWYHLTSTNSILWIYADLDAFLGIAKVGTTYENALGGWMPDSTIDQTEITAAGSISAGSDVVVAMPSVPTAWAVGTYLFVRDADNIERVEITDITSLNVTFDEFVDDYAAGSKFGLEYTVYCKNQRSAGSTYDFMIGHDGTKDVSLSAYYWAITGPNSGEALTGLYPAKKPYLFNANMIIGPIKNLYAVHSTFTSGTTHTIGSTNYRFISLYGANALMKEV